MNLIIWFVVLLGRSLHSPPAGDIEVSGVSLFTHKILLCLGSTLTLILIRIFIVVVTLFLLLFPLFLAALSH